MQLFVKTIPTLIVNADVVAVDDEPMLALRVLHPVSEAGTYMCWPSTVVSLSIGINTGVSHPPVFVPQMRGGALPPGTVTPKLSESQFPCLVADPAAASAAAGPGPTVMVVAVICKMLPCGGDAGQSITLPGHSAQRSRSPASTGTHQSCTCTQSGSRRSPWSGRSW